MIFETEVRDGVLRLGFEDGNRSSLRWLSTGWHGGFSRARYAYNITVPEGWECENIERYVGDMLDKRGFKNEGPKLLTGVDMEHARKASLGPVEVVVTAGLSNPASLPMEPVVSEERKDGVERPGTVNVVLGVEGGLSESAFAEVVSVVSEAKTATLLHETGFEITGTTSDAVVVGSRSEQTEHEYAGSMTEVGSCARVCVRDALKSSLRSRYGKGGGPNSVGEAEHGVVTEGKADVDEVL